MSRFVNLLAAGALVAPLLLPQAGHATPPESALDREKLIEREFKEGFERIFRGFDLLLRSVPQYAAPEVLENGDIVIRRKPPRSHPHRDDAHPPRGDWI